MSNSNHADFLVNGLQAEEGGPAAPQDPAPKRSRISIMNDAMIEASARPDGKFSQEIYLEGRQLSDRARFRGGVTDESILDMLESCSGFRRLVHSIGITVNAKEDSDTEVVFTMENWGKTEKYETGTHVSVSCPADGTETVINLEDIEWSPDDDVPGKFAIEFGYAGALATASLVLYLNDGFEVPESEHELPVDFESEAYQAMIDRSILSTGSSARLKKAIEKARRGEDVTLAYIGGSITQGAGAKPIHTASYAHLSYLLFKEKFGAGTEGENVRLIKAGVGGTPSELGIVRYDRDILRDGEVQPDVVVIEFAVNDAGDETKGNCYESLVLKALQADNQPAVILLFSVFMNDWNLQDRLAPVGWHYDLPMVSVKDAVVDQFRLSKSEGNIISKNQFFYDIYHPTNAGHRIMADCLARLFDAADQSETEEEERIPAGKPPVIGNDFVAMKLLDRSNYEGTAQIETGGFTAQDTDLQMIEMDSNPAGTPQFPFNWMHTPDSGEGSFKLSMKSRSLILVFKDSGSSEFGTADIEVDGQHWGSADPHEVNWTHCNAVLLYNEPESKEHTVEIRMKPGHEGKRFTILGFGYVV